MNLDDINKQMFALQNDFKQVKNTNSNQKPTASSPSFALENINSINFQEVNKPIETTQIKRPTKTGDHRNDINDKLNLMNTMTFLPTEISQNPPNTMPEFTRNYSALPQNQMQQNQMQYKSTNIENVDNNSQPNNFANYYNHNFDTLQKKTQKQNPQNPQNPQISSQQDINSYMTDSNSNMFLDTHSSGIPMINPRNMYSMGSYEEIPNKYNENGYSKVEDKKIDYRQKMNNKLDNFIFDNPNAIEPNPILIQHNNNKYGQTKDTRMIIQDSNKDYYRQSANDRMSQYSPLSRASNMPISMASMTVNDFYSNMNGNMNSNTNSNQSISQIKSNKDTLNSRIDNYVPLAKNIQYQTQQQSQTQNSQSLQQNNINQIKTFDNINGKLPNVVFNNLPVMSNSIQNSVQKIKK